MDIINIFTAKQWIFIILMSYGAVLCGLYKMLCAIKELKKTVDGCKELIDNGRKTLQTEHVTQNRVMSDTKEMVLAMAKQAGIFQ